MNTKYGRSREGAWIEIALSSREIIEYFVAPARERGLKYNYFLKVSGGCCRSREGAWIEIAGVATSSVTCTRRSREGAWIEINY